MSQNQYRKTGRPVNFNQHRGGKSGGGGGSSGPPPNPSLSSNRSFNRKYNNAQGGQPRASGLNATSEGNAPSATRAVQNGAHQQQPLSGVTDLPVTSASIPPSITPSKPSDEATQKMGRTVPIAPLSNVDPTGPDSNTAVAPPKAPGDVSRSSFPLQFGTINPCFMNGMQVPARTSSAPPNLDEQKRDQVRHESSRAVPALPTPSLPSKQPLPRKNTGTVDQASTGESHPVVARSKRDVQVSAPSPVTQSQKPSTHPLPGMPMQMPFHPPPHPVQFGPQIQSQGMSAAPLPIQVPVPLLGNPPLQQPTFVSGFPPHPIPSQGIMHQGQGLNFSSGMSPQMPPQLGNMGMNMPPQFPQQQAGKFGGTRIPVKITHPETHEELRLDGAPGPRPHPNMPPQSQSLSSFPPTHSINYHPNSYNNNSPVFFQPSNSLQPNNTQSSQPARFFNQVTVKPASIVYGEKDQLPSVSSPTAKDSQKHSKLHGAASIHTQRDSQMSSQSSVPQSKPGDGSLPSSVPAASKPSTVVVGSSLEGAPLCSSSSKTALVESSTSVPIGTTEEAPVPDSKDWQKKPGHRGPQSMQDQIAKQSLVPPSLSTVTKEVDMPALATNVNLETTREASSIHSTDLDTIDAKTKEGQTQYSSNPSGTMSFEGDPPMPETLSKNDKDLKLQKSLKQDSNTSGSSSESVSFKASELINQTEESSLQRVTDSIDCGTSVETTLKKFDGSAIGSVEGDSKDHSLSSSLSVIKDVKPDDSPSLVGLSARDGHVASKETDVSTSATGNQESDPRFCQSLSMTTSKGEDENTESNTAGSFAKEKSLTEQNMQKSTTRGKKKKKEIYKKADAAGATSDLYMAYKGPEEKKETATSAEIMDSTTSDGSKPVTPEVVQDVSSKKGTQIKVEPDDWEDAADVSSPKLETAENGQRVIQGFKNYGEDGDGTGTKKYSRDFLLKFADQYIDLPEDFDNNTPDILGSGMVANVNFTRESYPSPGRGPSGVSRSDRRGGGVAEDDKWNKLRGSAMPGRDVRLELAYGGNLMGFQPGQGSNYGVLRNPRSPSPIQYAGGILAGPMQSMGPPGGVQRNGVDADRWQRASAFQKGLMPSPQTPSQMMHRAEKKYEVGKVTDEEEAKQRQLKAILNKLTPQNFEKLFQQVKEVNIDNVTTLTGVISQIFDKALMEPTFCEMYANFCHHLASELPDLSVDNEKITFKRLLLNKCQEEFERGEREEQEANITDGDGETKLSDEEREEKRLKARRQMLGNIRLIGELYKKRMLTERIMHECIKKLLGEYQNPDEENIEALCKLMSTIGEMIDHPKAKEHMDFYFEMMSNLSNNMKLSSRVRFMLKDAIDLRKNKWQQRRKVEGPKKIEEVHRDAAQERQAQASRMSRTSSMSSSVRRGQPMDFVPRGSSMLSSPNSQMGGFRPVSPQIRGYGGQDARTDERQHSFDNRTFSVPLPQRSLGDEITLGPQGGLGRGMSFRGQGAAPSIPSTDMPSPGDSRRVSSGLNGYSPMPDRSTYGPREELVPRYMPDRSSQYDQPAGTQDRNMPYGSRDRSFDTAVPTSPPFRGGGGASFTQNVPLDSALPEEHLRDKSLNAIREFYSARDENEVALCVNELNAPSFYPSMISIWITDSFERKEKERDLFGKLLVNLAKSGDVILSQDQLIQGFESVLSSLEDAVNDAPKAAEYLGHLFGRVIIENVIPYNAIGHLIYEGGEEQGRLLEIGLAAEVLGSTLEVIKSEKGDSVLHEICRSSDLVLENFRPPGSNKQWKLDKFI
nr:eukaryotic translation initiation factor 4G [Ipomoea batatas]